MDGSQTRPRGRWLAGGLLLLLGALACISWPMTQPTAPAGETSLPPEALTVTALVLELTQRAQIPPITVPPLPTVTPGGQQAGPPPMPTILPTPVPTRRFMATPPATLPPTPANLPPISGLYAEVWDFPSGDYVRAQQGVYYASGGDLYEINLYERPFQEVTQGTFYPDLDIRYVRLVRSGEWYYALIRVHGLQPGQTSPTGDYGIEIDVDIDGRGEFLVWAQGPIPTTWETERVAVYQDVRPDDVEGPNVCRSDAPFTGNGYEHLVYRGDLRNPLTWVRWMWDQEGGKRYPVIVIAFHRLVLGGTDREFLWQAWADGRLRQPGSMAYHDRFTRPQAGIPYPNDPNFPIREIARVDNTCRATFGFTATGTEPCLCQGNPERPVPVCPIPKEPPNPQCRPGPGNTWICPDSQNQQVICRWDGDLCQWNCRQESLCPAPNLGVWQRLPVFPFPPLPTPQVVPSSGNLNPDGPDNVTWLPNLAALPAAQDPTPTPASPPGIIVPPPPGSSLQPITGLRIQDDIIQLPIPGSDNRTQECRWDPTLCRFDCRETEKVCPTTPTPPLGCQPGPNGSQLCPDASGNQWICQWDAQQCTWDCRPPFTPICPDPNNCPPPPPPPLICPEPSTGPGPQCQQLENGQWRCDFTDEIGGSVSLVCQWNAAKCDWECGGVCQPDDSCYLVPGEPEDRWVCPGRGEFKQCQWDEDECRWRCWEPIRKPDKQPDDEPVCQPENYCSYDPPLWYCEDGTFETCTYDGCQWVCEGPVDG